MSLYRYHNRTSPWFSRLFRRPLWLWLKYRFNIEVITPPEIAELEGPFILVANHVTFWDPFIAAIPLRKTVRFIASDNLFRKPLFRWVMKRLGAIPKTKFVSNPEIVRRIMEVVRSGGILGIFPEGRRTWDGRTDEIMPEVPRLLARLRLPVVGVKISGGYLSNPVWSRHSRRGKITAEYSLVIPGNTNQGTTPIEVSAKLGDFLQYNCEDWQQIFNTAFTGKKLAEYLERVLYICPACTTTGKLVSRKEQLYCSDCGYSVRYTEAGTFEQNTGPLIFSSLQEWNDWQTNKLNSMLTEKTGAVISDDKAFLWTGFKSTPLKKETSGIVELHSGELLFRGSDGTVYRFLSSDLEGLNMQGGNNLEFYHANKLYRINFSDPRVSSYKYLRGLLLLRKELEYIIPRNTNRLRTGM